MKKYRIVLGLLGIALSARLLVVGGEHEVTIGLLCIPMFALYLYYASDA